MGTLTILAIVIAIVIAGTLFLVCEDVATCFMAALLAFAFFAACGGAALTMAPDFTARFIVSPANSFFTFVIGCTQSIINWANSHNPFV